MAFAIGEVGFERGATQVLLDANLRIMNRFQDQGPERIDTKSLGGRSIGVEYIQSTDDRELRVASEKVTEAQATTIRTLLNGTGPLTVKPTAGDATEYTVAFTAEHELEPLIGHYTEAAPTGIRWWRFEARLLRL